jgi:D-serine deaminase-like pyridoxal phosphate-dependent protein
MIATHAYADVLEDHPAVGRPVSQLPTPAPLVDIDRLQKNIDTMAAFFRDRPCKLRAHGKTHRSPAIARLQVAAGSRGVTCAKVGMAEAMVAGGIDDVFVANQVVAAQAIDRLCSLAQKATVTVAVDNARNVADLSAAAQARGVTLRVVVEVDAGMGRCGTQPGQPTLHLASKVRNAPGLLFTGLHAYEGHCVQHPDFAYRKAKTEEMLGRAMETRDLLVREGLIVDVITCGGTGTYDISGVYPGVTEHQSGSYVYMDPSYTEKVLAFALAFSLLCTVVSRPTPDKVITDAGLQSLAADHGTPAAKDHPELEFGYLSEEHGRFKVRDGATTDLAVGDTLEVHPGHCCSAANLHDEVYAVRNGVVEAVWATTARGKST